MGQQAGCRRRSGAGARAVAAVAAATALLAFPAAASAASDGSAAAPAAPTAPSTTTTLPPLPTVDPSITDGQPAARLLGDALALVSTGSDGSALVSAISVTQGRLERDAQATRMAQAAADAADRDAAAAQAAADAAGRHYAGMTSAVRQAVVYLYTSGPGGMSVSAQAGALAAYASDYASSTLGPYGVLADWRATATARSAAVARAGRDAARARAELATALKVQSDEKQARARLVSELQAVSAASAGRIASDHLALAQQAGIELTSTDGALQFTPKTPVPAPLATTSVALSWAFAELGRPYVWGATGPGTFDCSGLTQYVWKAAGVSIPRVAADQDAWTVPVPLSQLLPGDLVFFGTTDIHHVGIYIGDGLMINAPHTGDVVRVSSIWWSDLAGFGRVHAKGTLVPPHMTPTPAAPAVPAVAITAGPVPSQPKPPAGWKPKPGETTPIVIANPRVKPGSPVSTTTTTLGSTGASAPTGPTTTSPTTVPAPTDPVTVLVTTLPATTVPVTTVPAATDPSTTVPAPATTTTTTIAP